MNKRKLGYTYKAKDCELNSQPARIIKRLKPEVTNPSTLKEARLCFAREVKLLNNLNSGQQPIPQLLESFEENQEFYLVHEFIEGDALSKEIKENEPWSEAQVIVLLQDVLNILVFVHQQGIKHLDIKPSNLIRQQSSQQSNGKIFLTDFGGVKEIATLSFDVENHIVQKQSVGTRGYMPPEQEDGLARPNSDIYALGMTAIQALTGVSPENVKKDPQTGKVIWPKGRANAS